jgi:hypothetical protein
MKTDYHCQYYHLLVLPINANQKYLGSIELSKHDYAWNHKVDEQLCVVSNFWIVVHGQVDPLSKHKHNYQWQLIY